MPAKDLSSNVWKRFILFPLLIQSPNLNLARINSVVTRARDQFFIGFPLFHLLILLDKVPREKELVYCRNN